MQLTRIIFFLLLGITMPLLQAAEVTKIVLHVNDGFKLGHLEKSVNNLFKEMGPEIDVKVVVNGKAVTRMLKGNVESEKIVKSVLNYQVPIGLCHNAVNNNHVKEEMLIDGLKVLENDGNVTILQYQKQGYYYIKL